MEGALTFLEESEPGYKSFTDLEVWRETRQFKIFIEQLAKTLPKEETFRLTDQVIWSVRSIDSNLSEGHGRFSFKGQIRFCVQSRASLNEVLNHCIDAYDCRCIASEKLAGCHTRFKRVEGLLNGYIAYLRKRAGA